MNLGAALAALGEAAEAELRYRQALEIAAGEATAVRNLAVLLHRAERYLEELALADEILGDHQDNAAAWLARGNALTGLDRHEEALESYRQAAALGEQDGEVKAAGALAAFGRFDEAGAELDAVVARRPNDAQARFERGMLRLQMRDFAGGWADYDQRWRTQHFVASSRGVIPSELVPRLAGELTRADLAGKRVLLIGEQGVGDQIMFASMIPDLLELTDRVTCVPEPKLVRLLKSSFRAATVVAPAEARIDSDTIDLFVPMGNLGHAVRRSGEDFTGRAYLRPAERVIASWAERLGPRVPGRQRVGISWRGGGPRTMRQTRSLRIEQLRPLLQIAGCDFVSVQYGDPRAEVEALNACSPTQVRVFDPDEISDLEDLAGLMLNLDLVVSVQNTTVHLCGALGVDCLAMIPRNAAWRYFAAGSSLPWYQSVRLFRRSETAEWETIVRQVAEEVSSRLG